MFTFATSKVMCVLYCIKSYHSGCNRVDTFTRGVLLPFIFRPSDDFYSCAMAPFWFGYSPGVQGCAGSDFSALRAASEPQCQIAVTPVFLQFSWLENAF